MPVKSTLSILTVLVTGITLFWHATDGWTAWTAETARRLAVLKSPIVLPEVAIEDSFGQPINLSNPDQIMLLDFVFTRCPTICIALGAEFQQIQHQLEKLPVSKKIQLASLSFDHANDGKAELTKYLSRYTTNFHNWKAGKFATRHELELLMDTIGVIAIPDEDYGYIHNAAIYLIQNGQLIEIFNPGETDKIIERIEWLTAND